MKPRILIFSSLIAILIAASVAVSQTTPPTIGIYASDALPEDLIRQIGETIFGTNNVEIVTFYNLAEVENSEKIDLLIASPYPTLIYTNHQKGKVLLESDQKEKVFLVASRETKIRSPEDLKGRIIGVGPIDTSITYLVAVLELRPLVQDIRTVPDRMGIYSIPDSISFKSLERQDRKAQLSHNKISASFFENPEDLEYGRVILRSSTPKLFVASTLNKEENSKIRDLLIKYEPSNTEPLPESSTQRTEIQNLLPQIGYSFHSPAEFGKLESRYKKFRADLPY